MQFEVRCRRKKNSIFFVHIFKILAVDKGGGGTPSICGPTFFGKFHCGQRWGGPLKKVCPVDIISGQPLILITTTTHPPHLDFTYEKTIHVQKSLETFGPHPDINGRTVRNREEHS